MIRTFFTLFILSFVSCQDSSSGDDTGAGGDLVLGTPDVPSARYTTLVHTSGPDVTILLVKDKLYDDCRVVLLLDEGRRGMLLLDDSTLCEDNANSYRSH